jgi:hypothetical protein
VRAAIVCSLADFSSETAKAVPFYFLQQRFCSSMKQPSFLGLRTSKAAQMGSPSTAPEPADVM